ncbi:PAX-interacting protein 1 [Carex littledalei]|uniref:PAX-interacting protein 1 n=1 Tax=Carex littledalei TaxID=544730 RepID=A0A833R1Y1_9POAL|nr:PAX-interacting protein 1 [Carex littledalei]
MECENENSLPTKRLTYVESQEPDELSQADALNAVDRFLSFEEEEEKENRYLGILSHNNCTDMVTETNTELNLSAKVVKYLSNQHEDKSSVRKLDVFDWAETCQEDGENCGTCDVGPATQMAAEVLEELFHAPPPNKIEETEMGSEIRGHPKRRRTIANKTLRRSVLHGLDGCVSDRLPLIMDTVKRKKRSHFVRHYESKHGNLSVCTGSDGGVDFSNERRNRRDMHDESTSFSDQRRIRSRVCAIRVIFSQNLDPKVVRQQKKILWQFGASTVLSMSDATHFVVDQFARTKNMLEAIAMGRHVVRRDWLENCAKAGRLGWRVSITPNVRPNKELLKCLVKASRGQLVERLSRYTMEDEDNLRGNFFIISCKEDYQICSPLLKIGIKAYDSELLLNGIVTQKLEFERHRLFARKR